MRGSIVMSEVGKSGTAGWIESVPELTKENAHRTAMSLIATFGIHAEAEARERLLLMYAIGSRQGILNWLKINSELIELLRNRDDEYPH